MTRLEQQIQFLVEIDKVKNIFARRIWQMETEKKMMLSILGILH